MLAQSYSGPEKDIMLYIGTGDSFLKDQLMPEALEKAASGNKLLNLDLKMQAGPTSMDVYVKKQSLSRPCSSD